MGFESYDDCDEDEQSPEGLQPLDEILRDAERWRKLMGCQRIRILGGGGLGKDALIGVEFYGTFPEDPPITSKSKEIFTHFVDHLEERK
jgi:hypothetical protein